MMLLKTVVHTADFHFSGSCLSFLKGRLASKWIDGKTIFSSFNGMLRHSQSERFDCTWSSSSCEGPTATTVERSSVTWILDWDQGSSHVSSPTGTRRITNRTYRLPGADECTEKVMPDRAGQGELPRLRLPKDAQMENPSYPAWQPELARIDGSTETGDTRFQLSRRVVALRRSANSLTDP